jgi:hypothetical protein
LFAGAEIESTRHMPERIAYQGRRSGRVYQTSLGTNPYGDGFLVPLGYARTPTGIET